MTATTSLSVGLEDSGYQLLKTFEGLEPGGWNFKVTPQAMTPTEILLHQCDAYQAFLNSLEGKKYEWGSFTLDDMSPDNLLRAFRDLRAKAVERALASDDPDAEKKAVEYIVLHDAYHVGQMVLIRMALDPSWDAYSIYS